MNSKGKEIKSKKTKFFLPAILMTILIFIASSIPQSDIKLPEFVWSDKVIHFFVYLIYGITLISAIYTFMRSKPEKQIKLTIIIFGTMFAATDEIHQFFVPGRFMELWDWTADAAGILVSFIFYKKITNYIRESYKYE